MKLNTVWLTVLTKVVNTIVNTVKQTVLDDDGMSEAGMCPEATVNSLYMGKEARTIIIQ